MNTTSINAAINDVADDLSLTTGELTWVVNAYVVASAALVAFAGRLGDRIGLRHAFAVGYAAFVIGSLAAALAPNGEVLIGARLFQGIAAAILMTGSTAAISTAVPTERKGLAMGVWGAVAGVGLAFGPLYGAALTDLIGWRSIYWADLVFITAGFLVAMVGLRGLPRPSGVHLDLVAALLLGAGIVCLVVAIQTIPTAGVGSPFVVGACVLGLVSLAAFAYVSSTRPPSQRFFDIGLFRHKEFVGGCVVSLAGFGSVFGVLYFFNLYAQSAVVLDYSAVTAALALLPFGVGLFVMSLVVGRLTDAVGYRLPLVTGTLIAAVGFLLLADIPPGSGGVDLWVPLALAGIGIGGTYVTAAAAGLAPIPAKYLGEAAGVINTMRYIGGSISLALGAALYTTVAVGTFNSRLAAAGQPSASTEDLDNALTGTNAGLENALNTLDGVDEATVAGAAQDAISDGFRASMAVLAVFMIAATITSALTLGPRSRRPEVAPRSVDSESR